MTGEPRRSGLRLVEAAAVGYAAGLVPSASTAATAASGGRVDLRASGTGNPGGANAAKVLGRRRALRRDGRRHLPNGWGGPATVGLPIAAAASSTVIAIRFGQGGTR